MRRRIYELCLIAAAMTLVLSGCSKEETEKRETEVSKTEASKDDIKEEKPEEDTKAEEEKTEEAKEVDFETLSKWSFEFASGAGGWSENFNIEKDGSFSGDFHDSDMGSTGDGYDNGTMYYCSYTGHFSNLEKVDDYTYSMKLTDISYDEASGKEEIKDDILYVYTESYALGGNDTFMVYLPGKKVSDIDEEIWMWLQWANTNTDQLDIICIVDEKNSYGIYSYVRPEPYDQAQMDYETYKSSFDYYMDLVNGADTTIEMEEYSKEAYRVADDLLNDLWRIIKASVSDEQYATILEEQRSWLKERDERGQQILDSDGGSLTNVDYNITMGEETISRCEALIEYLK